jgi:Ca2+-binding RTX toxin-like protein
MLVAATASLAPSAQAGAPRVDTSVMARAASHASQRAKAHFCHGHRATIVGTGHRDRIKGTNHRDVIVAGGGGDFIVSKGGNDLICAGSSNDVVDGGPGLDTVYGGTGKDLCFGVAREHASYHHQCDVHVPGSLGGGTRPRTTARSGRPTVLAGHPTHAQIRMVARALNRSTATYQADMPDCGVSKITLGNVGVSGYATDPSLVAIRPRFLPFNPTVGEFEAVQDTDYTLWNVPADGNLHAVAQGAYNVTPFRTYIVFYDVYWSDNGANFDGPNATSVEFPISTYQDHYFGGTTAACFT